MKILKVLSTSAIAAALLATCGMSAFAVDAPEIEEDVNAIVLGEGGDEDLDGEGEDEDLDGEGEDLDGDGEGEDLDGDGEGEDLDGDGEGEDLDGDGEGGEPEISDEDWAKFAEAMEALASLMDNSILVDENGEEVDDEVKAKLLVADTEEEAAAALGDGSYVFYIDGTDFMYLIHVENGEAETVVLTEEELKEALKESENSGEFTDDEDDDFGWDDDDDDEDSDDVEYNILDVVNAAKDAGVNSINVQTLRNFLILNDDYFDSDDYSDFIEAVNEIKDLYIAPLAASMFYKTPAQLTESERYDVYDALTKAEKDAIQKDFIDLAKDHGVLLTWDRDANGYPVVYASIYGDTKDAGTKASSGTQVATGASAVKDTGDVAQEGTSSAAAFAGVALALAAAGVVIVARKNRA